MRRLSLAIAFCLPLAASAQLLPDTEKAIDALIEKHLAASGEPSISIAIGKDGKLAYAKAYGNARLDPALPATAQMRYKIGSVTKQFVAAGVLLLGQDGKLSLDDKVAKFFPQLSGARDVSVRQLLAHTAGYVDYYPLEYAPVEMAAPTTADKIMNKYGRKPLAFKPGTRWDYSNTNYVIAGRIIEKVSGQTLERFLRERITAPLGMTSATDLDHADLGSGDPLGYERNALGPLRVPKPEGKGWTFAAGHFAMTPSDLVRWDLALINNTILSPASRALLTEEVVVPGGAETNYGLGIAVDVTPEGRARWSHGGGVAGFMSRNLVYPAEGLAIAILSNTADFRLAGNVEGALEEMLLPATAAAPAAEPEGAPQAAAAPPVPDAAARRDRELARRMFTDLQGGTPARSRMTADLARYLSGQVLSDITSSLAPKGEITAIDQIMEEDKAGMKMRIFRIKTGGGDLSVICMFTKDGKLAQYTVYGKQAQ
ncbi:serine hydrolase [Massilia sp. CF038]|uniref:serine hydrolase domain-containing protein n=1 Tax=Massilia sp. CF038 TaxID=1881045 RepID=UPI00092098DC|nr:serine hydrolase domain-containing protein [Massilia sp. CF038]SHH21100.1 CubicO group peptidase, beta-lactamase class C family [Massilia sp. CF038]